VNEHADGALFPHRIERLLADSGDAPVLESCERLRETLLAEAPANDDITAVVLKKST
jgi:hypothetical protein